MAAGVKRDRLISVSVFQKTGLLLHRAAQEGHLANVEAVLATGESVDVVDVVDVYGCTPLYWAAYYGHTEVARALIDAEADVNAVTGDGKTPLHEAAYKGHTEFVKMLIAARAKVHVVDKRGQTPLYWAAYHGHTEVARALIATGADLNAGNEDGQTPLYWAAYDGHTEVVKALIAAGANVHAVDKRGQTPLYWAAYDGYTEIAQALLISGAGLMVNFARDRINPALILKAVNLGTGDEALPPVLLIGARELSPELQASPNVITTLAGLRQNIRRYTPAQLLQLFQTVQFLVERRLRERGAVAAAAAAAEAHADGAAAAADGAVAQDDQTLRELSNFLLRRLTLQQRAALEVAREFHRGGRQFPGLPVSHNLAEIIVRCGGPFAQGFFQANERAIAEVTESAAARAAEPAGGGGGGAHASVHASSAADLR